MNKKFERWLKISVAPMIAAPILKLLAMTWRIDRIEHQSVYEIDAPRKIVAVWHGRLLITACVLRHHNIHVMVSDHEDGELITRIVERMGFKAVRGSSTRGGVKAAMGAVEAIQSGHIGGMLPDGPTGPRYKAKLGTVWLARETDAVLIPLSGSCVKGWQFFKSWDRFLVPKPFSRVTFAIGDPIKIEGEGNDAVKRTNRILEAKLKQLELVCDSACGRTPDDILTREDT